MLTNEMFRNKDPDKNKKYRALSPEEINEIIRKEYAAERSLKLYDD